MRRRTRASSGSPKVGFALSERGADREDIKDWFGHTDMKSTRVYTAASLKRIRKVSASVDGRFGWKNAPSDAPSLDRRTPQNVADSRLKRDNAITERRQAIRTRRGLKTA